MFFLSVFLSSTCLLLATILFVRSLHEINSVLSLQAFVQRVHVNGLGRTKDDIVISSVKDVFDADDFQSVSSHLLLY